MAADISVADDWLTHHALHQSPRNDFRFTYAGPVGTFTPLHHDVYGSYSWSANVVGRKRWWLVPPEVDMGHDGNVPFDLRELGDEVMSKVIVVDQDVSQLA